MKTVAILSALSLIGATAAAPSNPSKLLQNRRKHHQFKTNPPLNVTHGTRPSGQASEAIVYSSNWAGAVTTTSGVTQVQGTFVVPTVQEPPNASSGTDYAAVIWVGIDGSSCQSAILQTGVSLGIENGQASYGGWYEWFPNPLTGFSGFDVNPGDSIQATVVATSLVSGTATLDNLSTGQTVTQTFSNMGSVGSLCEADAEWIVEDVSVNGGLAPFADFGTVTFTGATYDSNGNTYGTGSADVYEIQGSSTCGLSGASGVSCTWS